MNYTVLLSLLLATALYGWLVRRYDTQRVRLLNRWHIVAFGATIAALYLALEPPLEPLADGSFLAHMAQHMLLVYVAAPLFLLSAPMMLVLGSFDLAKARRLGRFLRGPLWRVLTFPVFSWLFFMAVLWGAHFSPLYELALTHPAVHILEHALFLTSAILFWQAIIHIGPVSWPMNFPLRIVYVFLAMPQGAFLGLALYQTRMTLYPHYVVTHGGSAAALADQHAGGALMWIVGGLLLFAIFMLLATMWGCHERRLGEQLDAQFGARLRSGVLGVAFALAVLGLGAQAAPARLDQGRRSLSDSLLCMPRREPGGHHERAELAKCEHRRCRILPDHGQNARDRPIRAKPTSHADLFSRANRCIRRFRHGTLARKHRASSCR